MVVIFPMIIIVVGQVVGSLGSGWLEVGWLANRTAVDRETQRGDATSAGRVDFSAVCLVF